MRTKIITLVSAAAMILMISSVYSQEQKIDAGISNFSKYLGTWHSHFTMKAGGKTEVVDYTVVYTPVAEGHGVYMEETATSPTMGNYKCSNLIGYDPYAKKLHWYSVDNMGTAHDHTFTWVTPDHFTLAHSSLRDGKKYTESIDCKYKSENSCFLSYVVTLDGKEVEKSEGTFDRETNK
ncbi:MAG: hypothetical protein NTW10_00225 [Bacteroidetes bacterium]|nr:hypothetical protein [Bacteroidota bacterium]